MRHWRRFVAYSFALIAILAVAACSGGERACEPVPTAAVPTEGTPITAQTDATPTESGIEIVNARSLLGRRGSMRVIGEVQNDSDEYFRLKYQGVTATFCNSAGEAVASEPGVVNPHLVPPGETVPFDFWVRDASMRSTAAFKVVAEGRETLNKPVAGLEIQVAEKMVVTMNPGYFLIERRGQVINQNPVPYDAWVALAYYDESGAIVAADWTRAELSPIPAGGSSPFKMSAWIEHAFLANPEKMEFLKFPKFWVWGRNAN